MCYRYVCIGISLILLSVLSVSSQEIKCEDSLALVQKRVLVLQADRETKDAQLSALWLRLERAEQTVAETKSKVQNDK